MLALLPNYTGSTFSTESEWGRTAWLPVYEHWGTSDLMRTGAAIIVQRFSCLKSFHDDHKPITGISQSQDIESSQKTILSSRQCGRQLRLKPLECRKVGATVLCALDVFSACCKAYLTLECLGQRVPSLVRKPIGWASVNIAPAEIDTDVWRNSG